MLLTQRWLVVGIILASLAITACTPIQDVGGSSKRSGGEGRPNRAPVECPADERVTNAFYVGPYRGVENNVTATDMARDLQCAERFRADRFSHGFVTIFGSSRLDEQNYSPDPVVQAANRAVYAAVLEFAEVWAKRYGRQYPILTGAGPGLMEAGARGAMAGGGPSIGYTTYYDRIPNETAERPYGGDPTKAFWTYDGQPLISDGLIFSSVAMRETAMILHSAAIVLTPGGSGTEWEIFQVLETIKSKQLRKVPVYILGDRTIHWQSLDNRLADMVRRGTVAPDAIVLEYVADPTDLVNRLAAKPNPK